MSIRDIMANSSLGRGSQSKEKSQQLNWEMEEPIVPGPEIQEKPGKVKASSPPAEINPPDLSDTETLDTFFLNFFALWPQGSSPSDYQLHGLAIILNVTPAELEEHIYGMLGRVADSDEIESQDI